LLTKTHLNSLDSYFISGAPHIRLGIRCQDMLLNSGIMILQGGLDFLWTR